MPHDTDLACPVCDASDPAPFLHREAVPVHQNLLYDTPEAARAATRGDLDLRVCGICGFVFNTAFDPGLLEYGPAYENTQNHSPAFDAYTDELVEHLIRGGVRSGRVVEVGCGKGSFLTKLLSHPESRCEGVGFDPSYLGPDTALDGRLRFVRAFYGPESAIPADVVICRHVIEHVPDPLALLRTVRAAAGDSSRVYFETPCVEWVFRNRVPWDLFYEHCSLFTAHSLGLALARAGFRVTAVRHVFGGQYLWAEAVSVVRSLRERSSESARGASGLHGFAAAERDRLARWVQLLDQLNADGPAVVWGAGAKGVTFCNLADPDARRVAAVIDVNPAKQGHHLPGTGHPILAPVAAVGAAAVIVLNPNYTAEVADALGRLGSRAAVIDLMRWEEDHAADDRHGRRDRDRGDRGRPPRSPARLPGSVPPHQ
ncbi:MAG TPA: class I SAM-dependent methyltransferase [Fimbriiglobus sp.]|nr:class I SAM-dependent methyltransferase [Fimbriiglobus sp.]